MARAQTTDFLSNAKFRVTIVASAGGGVPSATFGTNEGGFTTCTTPELSLDEVLYKSGLDTYSKKFPGNPTVNDITMSRGVIRSGSALFKWVLAGLEGKEYRADILIEQYHRDETNANFSTGAATVADPGKDAAKSAAKRSYKLYNAFAKRVKVATDLDGQSSDISLEEVDISFESFEVLNSNSAITA